VNENSKIIIVILLEVYLAAPPTSMIKRDLLNYCWMARRVGMPSISFSTNIFSRSSRYNISSKIIGWFILLLRMVIVTTSNEKHFPCTFYDGKNQFP